MIDETFCDARGWKGFYQVTNYGRVWSISRGRFEAPTFKKGRPFYVLNKEEYPWFDFALKGCPDIEVSFSELLPVHPIHILAA
jgi:hypothetical protein